MQKFLFLLAIALFSSCRVNRPEQENSATEGHESQESIFFMNFKITKNPDGKSALTLISNTKASGKLKKGNEKSFNTENYLTVDLFQKDRPAETIRISHPLYRVVEYVDDDHKYKSKMIELEQEEFFFRLQVNGAAKVTISETVKNKAKTELLTLKI